jgi:CheY-like chemotaxis protein
LNQTTKPIRIFLADDNKEDRDTFKSVLEASEIPTTLQVCETCESLLTQLQAGENKPDIIFLDLKMPDRNGKDCLREIRRKADFNHIPVIIFTTTAYIEDITEVYENGANLYAPKNVFFTNNTEAFHMIVTTTLNKDHLSPTKDRFVLGHSGTFFHWI